MWQQNETIIIAQEGMNVKGGPLRESQDSDLYSLLLYAAIQHGSQKILHRELC